MEFDYLCVIRWPMETCTAPWHLLDELKVAIDLGRILDAWFNHVQRSANSAVDLLVKETDSGLGFIVAVILYDCSFALLGHAFF